MVVTAVQDSSGAAVCCMIAVLRVLPGPGRSDYGRRSPAPAPAISKAARTFSSADQDLLQRWSSTHIRLGPLIPAQRPIDPCWQMAVFVVEQSRCLGPSFQASVRSIPSLSLLSRALLCIACALAKVQSSIAWPPQQHQASMQTVQERQRLIVDRAQRVALVSTSNHRGRGSSGLQQAVAAGVPIDQNYLMTHRDVASQVSGVRGQPGVSLSLSPYPSNLPLTVRLWCLSVFVRYNKRIRDPGSTLVGSTSGYSWCARSGSVRKRRIENYSCGKLLTSEEVWRDGQFLFKRPLAYCFLESCIRV